MNYTHVCTRIQVLPINLANVLALKEVLPVLQMSRKLCVFAMHASGHVSVVMQGEACKVGHGDCSMESVCRVQRVECGVRKRSVQSAYMDQRCHQCDLTERWAFLSKSVLEACGKFFIPSVFALPGTLIQESDAVVPEFM